MSTVTQAPVPRFRVWVGGDVKTPIVLDREVMQLSASASLSPGGSWSVTLLPRTSSDVSSPADARRLLWLYEAIRPQAVVSLGVDEPGGIMLGLVDQVSKTTVLVGQRIQAGLMIRGSTMAKVLTQDSIVRATPAVQDYPRYRSDIEAALGAESPLIFDLEGTWGPHSKDGTPTFIASTLTDVIAWTLANTASMRLPLFAAITGGTGEPADYFQTSRCVTAGFASRLFSEGPTTYQGSVWSFLTSLVDQDFYELWVDSIPTSESQATGLPEVHLILRPKPFDEVGLEWAPITEDLGLKWDQLRTLVDGLEHHDIPLNEVLSYQLGVSDESVYSFYNVTSRTDIIGNTAARESGLYYPLVDLAMARREGLRTYESALSLVGGDLARKAAGDGDYTGEISTEVHEARNRLFNWYRANAWFEAGTVSVAGRDRYRPGDPVYLGWSPAPIGGQVGMRYYCNAVSWSWSFGGHYTCSLQLSRGHNGPMLDAIASQLRADGASFGVFGGFTET